jgi:uncharacterized SAM-binding protein YcdF (DUF218 family)
MYAVKKLLGFLFSPGIIILLFLSLGLVKLIFGTTSRRSGWAWIFLGTLCVYLFATAPLPYALLSPLECSYQPFIPAGNSNNIKYIVVLSGDLRRRAEVPPTSQLGAATALRVVEAVRLFRDLSFQPILIMSGGGPLPVGDYMAAFAHSLGVPADKLIAESQSLDTFGNAREVKPILKDAPFLLVTSASHLPRAMLIFQALGLRPIPAPADFNVPDSYDLRDFYPTGGYLTKMEAAVHEYLGLAYLKLFPGRAGQ